MTSGCVSEVQVSSYVLAGQRPYYELIETLSENDGGKAVCLGNLRDLRLRDVLEEGGVAIMPQDEEPSCQSYGVVEVDRECAMLQSTKLLASFRMRDSLVAV